MIPGKCDGVSKGTLPPVEVQPVGFTPKYGWPFVSRHRRGGRRSRPSRRTNLIVGACLLVALGLVIYFIIELVSRI